MKPTPSLSHLKQKIQKFIHERDWEQFHSPKNLSMSLAIEAAELMEHFQWVDGAEAATRAQDPRHRAAVAEEIADVCCYLLSLVNTLDLDLSEITADKLARNAVKYPLETFRGKFERL